MFYCVCFLIRETKQRLAPRKGIFSDLGRHFPFIFDIFKKKFQQSITTEEDHLSKNSDDSDRVNSSVRDSFCVKSTDGTSETDANSSKNQPLFHNSDEELSFSRFHFQSRFWETLNSVSNLFLH